MEGSCTCQIREQRLHLLPSGTVYWEDQQTLLLADLHLGKAGHFQKHGIPISSSLALNDLDRLAILFQAYDVRRIIFLGDLFHSSHNGEWNYLQSFFDEHSLEYFLVRGNHDILSQSHYDQAGLKVIEGVFHESPFCFVHEPIEEGTERQDNFVFAGHLHPGIRMVGDGRQTLRFPCFYINDNQMILPAFGSFTGLFMLYPEEGDQVFAIVENQVVRVF